MKLLTICLSILLVSCTSFPTIEPQERCFTQILTQDVDPETEKVFYTGYCRCHEYSWREDFIGRTSESVNKPLHYCDKFGGFSPDSTGRIYEWQESIRLWLKRKSKSE